jgi:NAD(P)-dependent dehydrogenase (short-subunit alcohol dehydrogenase family)
MARVAVVTGASSGIGEELVRQLRAQGWHTVGLSRRRSEADEHEECDVGDRAFVESAASNVLARHPQIDLLVNNAGLGAGASGFVDADPARVEEVVRTNYLGSLWVARAFLPGLGRGSHLVNLVSVAGLVANGPYSASKHAQLALSRSLAVELAPRGISVHTVNPGFVETPGFPQRSRRSALLNRIVVQPPFVAERILAAVEHDRREVIVPRWYRLVALLQALAPSGFARLRALMRR